MAEHKNPLTALARRQQPVRRGGPRGAARFAPTEKPKKLRVTLKRLSTLFRPIKGSLLFVFFLIIVDCAVTLLIPYLIGLGINQISTEVHHVRFRLLIEILLVLAAFYLLDALLTFMQGWVMAAAGQKIVIRLRKDLFNKLQKLPLRFFDSQPHGDTMSRLTNDIENIDVTLAQSTVQLMNDCLMIGGTLVLMLEFNPILTAASLITAPMFFFLTRLIAPRTSRFFSQQQKQLGELNSRIEESIAGIDLVKAFNHEDEEIQRFVETNARLTDVGAKAQVWSGYLMPLMNVINNLGFAAVATVGGYLALRHQITVGMIASFLTYSRQFTRPLNDVASIFNTLLSAIAGAERVFEILDQQEEVPDANRAIPIQNYRGHLSFDSVSFGYQADRMILKKVSFNILPGQQIALVGPTGAGKTTIINLLTRFYEVNEGQILLDGSPISNFKRTEYRNLFGMVLQEPYLFRGTFLENICYGNSEASRSDAIRAAKAAGCDAFIEKLPAGYDTTLIENGQELSEGQKQLLTIARALLKDPRILIMDEATSHVDSLTEIAVQNALHRLLKGRTSVIIAHRLATIRSADCILVLENGQIAERGTHEELMRRNGLYSAMYRNQFKD